MFLLVFLLFVHVVVSSTPAPSTTPSQTASKSQPVPGYSVFFFFCKLFTFAMGQLPKICVRIGILMHRIFNFYFVGSRSFSTRLTSVTFAEDKVLIFLILRKNAKIVQL